MLSFKQAQWIGKQAAFDTTRTYDTIESLPAEGKQRAVRPRGVGGGVGGLAAPGRVLARGCNARSPSGEGVSRPLSVGGGGEP